jgi:hypothetical protein
VVSQGAQGRGKAARRTNFEPGEQRQGVSASLMDGRRSCSPSMRWGALCVVRIRLHRAQRKPGRPSSEQDGWVGRSMDRRYRFHGCHADTRYFAVPVSPSSRSSSPLWTPRERAKERAPATRRRPAIQTVWSSITGQDRASPGTTPTTIAYDSNGPAVKRAQRRVPGKSPRSYGNVQEQCHRFGPRVRQTSRSRSSSTNRSDEQDQEEEQ